MSKPKLKLGEMKKIPGTKTMYYIGVQRNGKNLTIKAQCKPRRKKRSIEMDRRHRSKTRITNKQLQKGFGHVGDTRHQQQTHGKKRK